MNVPNEKFLSVYNKKLLISLNNRRVSEFFIFSKILDCGIKIFQFYLD